jgi:hypothetical protein
MAASRGRHWRTGRTVLEIASRLFLIREPRTQDTDYAVDDGGMLTLRAPLKGRKRRGFPTAARNWRGDGVVR